MGRLHLQQKTDLAPLKIILWGGGIRRVWFNGRTSAFQADDAGSIPATRSRSYRQRQLTLI
jgi:hypothetical protein